VESRTEDWVCVHISRDKIVQQDDKIRTLSSFTILRNHDNCPSIRQNIVTCISIARQRLGEHIPARDNECKNRTSIARKQISEQAPLTIETIFSMGSVQSV
jgi:hypothetical protein